MTVTYHGGRRIQGTQADFDGIPAVQGGWKELGRTTLGGTADTISVGSLSDKRYYMVLVDQRASGNTNHGFRLNGDTGNNYAQRASADGGAENTLTSASTLLGNWGSAVTTNAFHVGYLANYSTKEKLAIIHNVQQKTAGAGTAPSRQEGVGKHAQTSNPINAVSLTNTDSGDYTSGSEVVVLGWDPADTHTSNFWEELASADLSGGSSDNFSSGTFTNKKYLWVQAYITATGGTKRVYGRFNGVTGNNYALRSSANGSEFTDTSQNQANLDTGNTDANPVFVNMFIVNNGTNEPLSICHTINRGSSGSANAPERGETVWKSASTTAITSVSFHNIVGTGNFGTESIMKVWGAD